MAELDTSIKITDIMTRNPTTVKAETTVLEVKEIFGKAPFNCLPILHEGKLVGLVTPKDLMHMRIIHIDGSQYGGY
jgi:CBS domain-containing protein